VGAAAVAVPVPEALPDAAVESELPVVVAAAIAADVDELWRASAPVSDPEPPPHAANNTAALTLDRVDM
jgi:hypothetical protein